MQLNKITVNLRIQSKSKKFASDAWIVLFILNVSEGESVLEQIKDFFIRHFDTFENIGWTIVKIILLFVVIRFAVVLLNKLIRHFLHSQGKIDERRQNALAKLLSNMIRFIAYFILILTILPMFGINIAALLAGAGVVGIAIGFGAQNLLKDFFNGFFILLEDQYGVEDHVVINGEWGQVRDVSLRLTVLQNWTGEMKYIPNGQITQVINYSQENSIADVMIEVGYNTDTDLAIDIIHRVALKVAEQDENVVGEIGMMGVNSLNPSSYTIRLYVECLPYTHWGVIRQIKHEAQKEFVKNGIDLPIQKVSYMPEKEENI